MNLKTVLVEIFSALLLMAAWIVGCGVLATTQATFRSAWWETGAWGAWWVGPAVGAAYLVAGFLVSSSDGLGGDRSARILLRATFVLASAALGLVVEALRESRFAPDDFLLSHSPEPVGPAAAAWVLAAASALLFAFLLRARLNATRP